ncbi:desmocollin 2 like [Melanotaenia boesemani]|uniref:desmocollin 2 like n=1 Tax=Melanotaenia boesemani TaxID=1250792 RepID=UPI001C03F037|nr:desmocollin 2 like [Melanotaenia boesemani]
MANVFIFTICSVLLMSRAESCYIPDSLYVPVPQFIPVGYQITKVETADCDIKTLRLTVEDPSFTIHSNGAIVTLTPVTLATRGRTFSVRAQDNNGPGSEMEVHLVRQTVKETDHSGQVLLKRVKRRWSPPPIHVLENDKGPFPRKIEKVVSSAAATHKLYYTISGSGVDEAPLGVFSIDRDTGELNAHKPVDREEYATLKLRFRAYDVQTKQEADKYLDLQVIIDDMNDNAPEFQGELKFTVPERSSIGMMVGTVNATDRDQINTSHVRIRFTLMDASKLFAIDPLTGVITTAVNTLDREVQDTHMVLVKIQDLEGAPNGLFSTATATITLSDINDNPPTFTKTSYEASIQENESGKLILRIPVEDKDLINTPNWISKFVITKGNEDGNFRIDSDPKTNEGLLYVVKPLDYEKNKKVRLEISAQNEAKLVGTTAQWLSVPVDVNVINVDEGPQFSAPTIRINVKENTPNGTIIGTYTAKDPETNSADGIMYYKIEDPAFWINVDRNTGELRVANTIDRESHFVQDGIYNITVKAVDKSSKVGLGTVILVIEDVNDNVPKIPSNLVLCEDKDGKVGSVIVVAEDKDDSPFSSPFTFSFPPDHDGKWSVRPFNATAAVLQPAKELPRGIYEVPLIVRDLQGVGATQMTTVMICQCRDGVCIAKRSSVTFGPQAALAMLLPLLLLLLLCLLLIFFCITRREKLELEDMGYSGGHLLPSNTEAPGDEVDSNLIGMGLEQALKGSVKGSALNAGWLGNQSSSTIGGHGIHDIGNYQGAISTTKMQEYSSGQYEHQYGQHVGSQLLGNGMGFDYRHVAQDSSYLHTWQTNGVYLQRKLDHMRTEGDGRYADDIIHSYGYEGTGSVAGSVGCCSDHGDNDNLDFLNTLGPKFKCLADVCRKT